MESNNRNKDNENIKKVEEWMEHQYDPGHFLGGNVPPFYSNPAKPKRLAIFLLVFGLGTGIIYTIILLNVLITTGQVLGTAIFTCIIYGLCLIQIIGGIRTLSKVYSKTQIHKIAKWLSIIGISSVIIIGVGIWTLSQFKVTNEIKIMNTEQFTIRQEQFKNYIYLQENKIELTCNEDDYEILWAYNIVPKGSIKIIYEHYTFNSDKGKVIKVLKLDTN
jgi:hypothetical protein